VGLLDRFRQKRPPPDKVDEISIRQLRAIGADLERPRHVLHFLYFDREQDARSAADATGAAGYETTVMPPAEQIEQWCVRAETTRVVNESTIRAFRAWFELLASEHAGEYDGWEAAAKP
jgi:hypothetical protein